VVADTTGPRVSTEVALEHYVIVEGTRKDWYLAVQALNLGFVLVLVLDNMRQVLRAWYNTPNHRQTLCSNPQSAQPNPALT